VECLSVSQQPHGAGAVIVGIRRVRRIRRQSPTLALRAECIFDGTLYGAGGRVEASLQGILGVFAL